MFVASCKSAEPEPSECVPGARGCPCGTGAACDNDLTCLDGFCVPAAACARGSEGCACSADGDCASIDGEPLACIRGACERAGCPSGSLECPCGPVGSCEPVEGQPVRCVDRVCALGACMGAPLHEAEGACAAALHRLALVVSGAGVAACDVLVELGAARPRRVSFPAAVMGASVRHRATSGCRS